MSVVSEIKNGVNRSCAISGASLVLKVLDNNKEFISTSNDKLIRLYNVDIDNNCNNINIEERLRIKEPNFIYDIEM